jgi:hypothetical protein
MPFTPARINQQKLAITPPRQCGPAMVVLALMTDDLRFEDPGTRLGLGATAKAACCNSGRSSRGSQKLTAIKQIALSAFHDL